MTRHKLQSMSRPAAGRPGAPSQPPVRVVRRGGGRHRRWVLAALLVPVFFSAVIAVGVYLMWHRQMSFFKPPPVGARPLPSPAASALPPARRFPIT